jgi:hypothetical protein
LTGNDKRFESATISNYVRHARGALAVSRHWDWNDIGGRLRWQSPGSKDLNLYSSSTRSSASTPSGVGTSVTASAAGCSSFGFLRIWPRIALGNDQVSYRIASDPTCGDAWALFFQIDKVSWVLDIAVDKPSIPEPGSSGVSNKGRGGDRH